MVDELSEISRAKPGQRAGALRLALREVAENFREPLVAQLLAAVINDDRVLNGLWVATDRAQRITGAVWAQFQSGATAAVWPPQLVASEPASTGARLTVALADSLAHESIRIAQALLPKGQSEQADWLKAAGLAHITDLLYLVSLEESFPADAPAAEFFFEPFNNSGYGRLAKLAEATYRQTLDCPQLNDIRAIDDVLSGYRESGQYDPARWLIVRRGDRDIGCLILTDHAESDQWELVYMGLVPEARGHGWGLQLVRYAQWLTRRAHRSRLVLAVDAANAPAIAMYSAAGFVTWDERSVFLRVFPRAARHA